MLEETSLTGALTNDYVFFGNGRVAQRTSSAAIYYYFGDHLGTSRVMTTSAGAVCYSADFYPFGGERVFTDTCAQNYKFTGKERDTETGNDNFGARYYTSSFGRFESADWSATPEAVPYANLSNPPSAINQVSVLGNSVTISYAAGVSDADRLATGTAIATAAAIINASKSELTKSEITDVEAVKGIYVVPSEKGNALAVAVTNKGTQESVEHDLGIKAKIGTFVLNASLLSRASSGYLASVFVHEGVHIIDRASESGIAERKAYAAQYGVSSIFHLTLSEIRFIKQECGAGCQ